MVKYFFLEKNDNTYTTLPHTRTALTHAMINIHGKPDPHYRYTMHKLDTVCKRNNKTYFLNLPTVSEELKRNSDEILKWFALTLGVNSNVKEVSLAGKYETSTLQTHFQTYINTHVLCDICGNPETIYLPMLKNVLAKKCASCGGTSIVKVLPKMIKMFVGLSQ